MGVYWLLKVQETQDKSIVIEIIWKIDFLSSIYSQNIVGSIVVSKKQSFLFWELTYMLWK